MFFIIMQTILPKFHGLKQLSSYVLVLGPPYSLKHYGGPLRALVMWVVSVNTHLIISQN